MLKLALPECCRVYCCLYAVEYLVALGENLKVLVLLRPVHLRDKVKFGEALVDSFHGESSTPCALSFAAIQSRFHRCRCISSISLLMHRPHE